MDQGVGGVARLHRLALFLVLLGVFFGFVDHALDVIVRKPAGSLDADPLFLAGRLVLGRHVDDAVGVDVEGDVYLRHAAGRRRNADEVELAERLVVGSHFPLALEDADGDRGLVVLGSREDLALARRDGDVAVDQAREDAAQGLDAERQRRHVEEQHVLDVALQHAALDGGADGDHLVRVDALVGLAVEEFLYRFDDFGHAGHAADQDHLVDVLGLESGVLERFFAGLDGALDQILDERLKLGAGQLDVEVLRPRLISANERLVDLGLHGARQLDLGLFGRFFKPLQGQFVFAQINALFLLELISQEIDDVVVEVLAAKEGVAVGRFDLEHAVADLQDRNVESAAAEVVDGDGAGGFLFQAVGQGGRRRLVDDAQHFEAGDLAGVLGRLALGIVKIGGNRDHCLGDGLAEIAFRRFLHFLEDEGADLTGRIFFVLDLDPGVAVFAFDDFIGNQLLVLFGDRIVKPTADQALDGGQRVSRVGHRLALGRLPDQAFTVFGEGDHGRRRARAFGVFDNLGVFAFHQGDAGIGRP